jgi:hypothetical protein
MDKTVPLGLLKNSQNNKFKVDVFSICKSVSTQSLNTKLVLHNLTELLVKHEDCWSTHLGFSEL